MRTPAIAAALVAAALALVVPAATSAKEIKEGTVCGASGCETVTDRELLMALVDGGGISSEPPQAGPFYRVEIVMAGEGEMHSFETQMVPSRDALRGDDGTWMQLPAAAKRALDQVVGEDLEPYPASGLIGAAPAPDLAPPASDRGGLSWLQGGLVVGGLILLAAAVIVLSQGRRPSWLRRRGPGTAPTS
jgi:hypothetical protein